MELSELPSFNQGPVSFPPASQRLLCNCMTPSVNSGSEKLCAKHGTLTATMPQEVGPRQAGPCPVERPLGGAAHLCVLRPVCQPG